MRTVTSTAEMQRIAEELRRSGKRIGVVPTMGFLHDGHLSLIRTARERSEAVIVTVFVNPTQFGPNEDFTSYPRDLLRDERMASSSGADYLFAPGPGEMYGKDHGTSVDVGPVSECLEGLSRPGHFRGVATVVAKLFNITKPDVAVFGQKDAQQTVVIRRLIEDLNFSIELIVAPTVREEDGLAMSSRNIYLSPPERAESTVLYRSLLRADELVRRGERDCRVIRDAIAAMIASGPSAKIDYISIAAADTLRELTCLETGQRVLISLAVRIGRTRLIDNVPVTV